MLLKDMKLLAKSIVAVIAILILLRACGPFGSGVNPLIGQLAPDFTLGTLSGREKTMGLFRDGQPAVIFFWTTWCPHCRGQLKELTQQRANIEEKGIKIILVDIGEDIREVKAYFNENNISFDTFLDQDGVVVDSYDIIGVPMFFLVNARGFVVAAEHELGSGYEEILLGLLP